MFAACGCSFQKGIISGILCRKKSRILNLDQKLKLPSGGRYFEVESALLQYTRAPGNYQDDPHVETSSYILEVEMDCQFWSACFPWARFQVGSVIM